MQAKNSNMSECKNGPGTLPPYSGPEKTVLAVTNQTLEMLDVPRAAEQKDHLVRYRVQFKSQHLWSVMVWGIALVHMAWVGCTCGKASLILNGT